METDVKNREAKNALAFLDHVGKLAGRKMRPLSYGTLNNMHLLGLAKPKGESVEMVNSPDRLPQDTVDAFMFLQAAPMPEVSKAVRRFNREGCTSEAWETFINESVAPFLATLAPAEIDELTEQLESMDEIAAAQVNAVPPESAGKGEPNDPNS